MTDKSIAQALGMTPENLTRTYKKSKDEKKIFMYNALKIGVECMDNNITPADIEALIAYKYKLLNIKV